MNECALATLAASSISIKLASGLPNSIFSLMVVANSAGSWLTSPICCLSHLKFKVLMSCPSSRTCPAQFYCLVTEIFIPKIIFRSTTLISHSFPCFCMELFIVFNTLKQNLLYKGLIDKNFLTTNMVRESYLWLSEFDISISKVLSPHQPPEVFMLPIRVEDQFHYFKLPEVGS